MGLVFGKRIRIGGNETVDLSTRGASVATRVGRVTGNSRGPRLDPDPARLSVRCGRRW